MARAIRLAAAVTSALLVSLLVVTRADALTGTAAGGGGELATVGELAIADDDGGGALFSAATLAPGETRSRCIELTYTGDVDDVAVTLSAVVTDGGLADHLRVTIDEGRGASFGDCAGFAPDATVHDGSLAGLDGAEVGAWQADPSDRVRSYRFTVRLADGAPSGADAAADLVWTAVG